MVKTIQLTIEAGDLDSGASKVLTLPCNLRAELEKHYNYVILSATPNIPLSRNDDIKGLNDILDEINSENPGMTEDYLKVLVEADTSGDLFDEGFVHKLKENEFMFEDISNIQWAMNTKETAGCYLATELKVPFDCGITSEMLDIIGGCTLVDYINWEQVWEQYASIGFKLIEHDRPGHRNSGRYIVHINSFRGEF